MEPNYFCFACRDSPVQSFSCSCYVLSWGGTTQHFLPISVCLLHFFAVLSSSPSDTDSVRAEMRYELEKVWILYPTAKDHYSEHFKVFLSPFPAIPLWYDLPYYRNQNVFVFTICMWKSLATFLLHCFQKPLLLAGQNKSCPDCYGFVQNKIKRLLMFYSLYCCFLIFCSSYSYVIVKWIFFGVFSLFRQNNHDFIC